MLFRNKDGILVEINKNDFYNDYLFNKKMMEFKITFAKQDKIDVKHNYSETLLKSLIPETF